MNDLLGLSRIASKALTILFLTLLIAFALNFLFKTIDGVVSQFNNAVTLKLSLYSFIIFVSLLLINYISQKPNDEVTVEESSLSEAFRVQDTSVFENLSSKFLSGFIHGLTKPK